MSAQGGFDVSRNHGAELPTAPECPVNGLQRRSFAARRVVYVTTLSALAAFLCFYHLGDSDRMLFGDEAIYAVVVDNMRSSGDWLTPSYVHGRPFHDKPPLYFWLTCLTFSWLEDGYSALPYRFWAACFGVGCVLLSYWLGTLWGKDEIGLLAGACLLLNERFLLLLGARYGNLDTMLTFFVTLSFVLYLRQVRRRGAFLLWGLLGAALAAACMVKPPVIGVFFLGVVSLHHIATRRDLTWRQRLLGPMLGAGVCLALATPWHLYQWRLWGNEFIEGYFVERVVMRAARGYAAHFEGPWFYWLNIQSSSHLFHAVWLAVAAGACACWLGSRRREWSALLLVSVGFVAAMSCSASKLPGYVQSIYPALSVVLAIFFMDLVPAAVAWCTRRRTLWWCVAGGVVPIVMLTSDAKLIRYGLRYRTSHYDPIILYQRASAVVQQGLGRFVLFQFPKPDQHPGSLQSGLTGRDLFYSRYMTLASHVSSVAELRQLLQPGGPAVIVCAPAAKPEEILRQIGLAEAAETRSTSRARISWPVIAVNDGFTHLGLQSVGK